MRVHSRAVPSMVLLVLVAAAAVASGKSLAVSQRTAKPARLPAQRCPHLVHLEWTGQCLSATACDQLQALVTKSGGAGAALSAPDHCQSFFGAAAPHTPTSTAVCCPDLACAARVAKEASSFAASAHSCLRILDGQPLPRTVKDAGGLPQSEFRVQRPGEIHQGPAMLALGSASAGAAIVALLMAAILITYRITIQRMSSNTSPPQENDTVDAEVDLAEWPYERAANLVALARNGAAADIAQSAEMQAASLALLAHSYEQQRPAPGSAATPPHERSYPSPAAAAAAAAAAAVVSQANPGLGYLQWAHSMANPAALQHMTPTGFPLGVAGAAPAPAITSASHPAPAQQQRQCVICLAPVRQQKDYCRTCYCGFFNDVKKVARTAQRNNLPFNLTGDLQLDLAEFVRRHRDISSCPNDFNCPAPQPVAASAERVRARCHRCRTLVTAHLLPELAHRILRNVLQPKDGPEYTERPTSHSHSSESSRMRHKRETASSVPPPPASLEAAPAELHYQHQQHQQQQQQMLMSHASMAQLYPPLGQSVSSAGVQLPGIFMMPMGLPVPQLLRPMPGGVGMMSHPSMEPPPHH
eukprot:m.190871 g.190871  ORF g.190871 m.190871 type:complete len:584 (+) comp10588_c0_seq11:202-1953(+)